DLKPANVMLGRDGRPRLVDFGLAARLNRAAQGGTPLYMAPEQWRGEPQRAATDVWALGLLLIEMFTGKPALSGTATELRDRFEGPLAAPPTPPPDVTGPIAALLTRCLALDPEARPRAEAVAQALDEVLVSPAVTAGSPFRGLAAFEADQAAHFLGREGETDAAVELLRRGSAVLVTGPSGVGKSSLVLAGILPRLTERGPLEIIRLRPGDRPLNRLANRILPDGGPAERDGLAREIGAEAGRLEVVLLAHAQRARATVVVVVDQLEELFTLSDPAQQGPFARALAAAVHDPGQPIRLVASMRDDHYGRLARVPQLLAALGAPLFVGPMDRVRLRRAFVRPVEARGYRFDDPELVTPLVDALDGSPAALPLMQFCGEQLWEQRNEAQRTLPIAELTRGGGLAGVLQHTAENFMRTLSQSRLDAVRDVCIQLVAADGTRRVLARAQIGDAPARAEALEALIAARLVVARADPDGTDQVVELAHEALVTGWPRLSGWIEGSKAGRAALSEVESVAGYWVDQGRPDRLLWPQGKAQVIQDQLAEVQLQPPADAAAFLARSVIWHRRRQRRRRRLGLLVAGLVLAGILGVHRQMQRQSLALGDVGLFRVEIETFNWDPLTGEVQRAQARPTWRLHQAPDGWWHGDALPPPLPFDVHGDMMEASGPALLVVEGRGEGGADCGPSVIPVQLPGFESRDAPPLLRFTVPTCAASAALTQPVPAGEAMLGGAGEPPLPPDAHAKLAPLRPVFVAGFAIDRHEATNAAYQAFLKAVAPGRFEAPPYGNHQIPKDATHPLSPVTRITAYEAAAFCRWQGKRLPTADEWEKAARGGLVVGAQRNPRPERSMPNGGPLIEVDPPRNARLATAPTDDVSPYGVVGMASNVWEWVATPSFDDDPHWWQLRGGGWTAKNATERSLLHRNPRHINDRYFDAGVRCLVPEPALAPGRATR
ncbi:MAG: SUMF1/EgtB/PvdO family nonheme iron enzyme, partial [Myxococcales bacterium]|nr:SUMF1/EgtB/PvdO family nonheme iron enzyme [Myxococcales bacterium]